MIDSAISFEFVGDNHKDFYRIEFMRVGHKGWFHRRWQVHIYVNNSKIHSTFVHNTWLAAFPNRGDALYYVVELGLVDEAFV
ncbi:MAG: hypothetical protein WDO15_11255 [Bacteroidota bacterium]